MNTVQPIRNIETVKGIAQNLKEHSERDYIMFLLGIYLGFRISDILKMRVRDIRGRHYLTVKQTKTKNSVTLPINKDLKRAIDIYCEDKQDNDYLIRSRQGGANRPISRIRAYMILSGAGRYFGLDSIGCHTMRKTFGYHLFKKTNNLELVRMALGQRDENSTRHYIGLDAEDVSKAVMGLRFL